MDKKSCINCAWFCHADGKCYGNPFMWSGMEVGATLTVPAEEGCCRDWRSDGLGDEERASLYPEYTLVTMEAVICQ